MLFDDLHRDLKMDFSYDSADWKTVLPAEARKSLKACRPARSKKNSVSASDLEKILGKEQPDHDMSNDEEF